MLILGKLRRLQKPSAVPKLAVAQMRGSLSVSFDTEHQMDSTLNDKLMEGQLASLDEQFSNLRREAGVNPSDPPASIKTFRAPRATIYRLASWR